MHGGDVRVIERGGGARLAHQALRGLGGVGVGASCTVLSATLRLSRVSSASQTTPIPPAPSWRMI